MSPFSILKRIFKPPRTGAFTLGKRGSPGIPGGGEDIVDGKHLERPPYTTRRAARAEKKLWSTAGGIWAKPGSPESQVPPRKSPFGGMSHEKRRILSQDLSKSLDKNLQVVLDLFHAPRNAGLIVRGIVVETKKGPVRIALLYMEGLIDGGTVKHNLITPLVELNRLDKPVDLTVDSMFHFISETQLFRARKYFQLAVALVEGECVLLVDGESEAITADTRSIEHRQVEESPTEAVVRGPHEGFVENLRANIALVRRRLATPDLVAERHMVGARGHSPVDIVYLEGVVNPKLVDEVRRLIDSASADVVPAGDAVRYLMPTRWFAFPTYISTERPDRVAAMVAEGHIALINDSPTAVLFPCTIWGLMHSAEDYYIHPFPATALRLVRYMALFATIYASAMYVAVVTFHPEMIPTELMFAIASSREVVPFPAALEVTLMEIAFELVREAGVRIPTVIGPTIGILGAVVLGQAVVQASIVSPILVVVVAIAGLGSFAIPNYDLGLFARVTKFLMIAAAAIFGIPGVTLASVAMLAQILSLRSMGTPVTAPLIPSWKRNRDLIVTAPLDQLKIRPHFLRPLEERVAPEEATGGPSPRTNAEMREASKGGRRRVRK
jgi:spore germination protein KA